MAGAVNLTQDEARGRAALIRDVRYRVALDLTGADGFATDSTVAFECAEPGAETFLDFTAPSVSRIELNGTAVPLGAFDGHRIHLSGLRGHNEVRVAGTGAYHRTEMGMHRFVDPADDRIYLHTDFEPFDAHRVFACFDQPDLKGSFDFIVTVPNGWVVVSNAPPSGEPIRRDGVATWTFQRTPVVPPYVTAVVAGEYHVVRDRHGQIDLGLLCRQSLAAHLDSDELFEVTKQGFDFFEAAFGYPYAFGKYDQAFIPESNSGAMENAGCITFNDIYLFRSRVTDAARERRAETVLHEMAHMWFGDLVTMRWWNDLWLNESFASYMAVFSEAEATRWKEAWATFADSEKTWAYRQDQLPTTHPIVAEIPDIESIYLNFDGITYAKGASVLRQLVAWVGQEQFLEGVKLYTKRHEFGNAELDDFLGSLEEVSGRDLHAWSKEWLEAAGVNTLRARSEVADRDGREVFTSFQLAQEAPEEWPTLRSHRVGIGLYDNIGNGSLTLRRRVEIDASGERTDVPELIGEDVPALVLVNDGDLTFAKIRLDERSLSTVVSRLGDLTDPLARTLCWTACWDMTRDAEMPARDYVRLVVGNIDREQKIGVVQSLLAQAAASIHVFGDPENRERAGEALAGAALEGLRRAAPASDHQLAWARAFIAAAGLGEHVEIVRGLLDGSEAFQGLSVDTELRWHIVRSLAAGGHAGPDDIEAERVRDHTDRGDRHAAACRAALPDPEAKEEAWRFVVGGEDLPLALTEEVMAGFQQYDQESMLQPFVHRFFEDLPGVWERFDVHDALAFGRRMYPHMVISDETVAETQAYLAKPDVPAPIRRLLLEGLDGVTRALRARAVDAAAASD